ncbi:FAD-dependent oxidoreductase [Falsirhodobacter algicola]|uniref:D-amino-acid oxidase n=1 Tax=Falsirhodobacter algicola TaxID=2692330 RepID=A0A8J8MV96_9RHOB|nr:FAD-dependent oxidoreductase [Falsirhodobacter algicola]QUS37164.1 FAD-dependent oxidoreductase [Falsirhodobacter algicola]
MTAITVIGCGVAGLAVAAELTARGRPLRLLDRQADAGPHQCSWWAGGMLAPDCEGDTAEEAVVRLGREAADWWQAQGAAVTRAGTLVLAPQRDRAEIDRFARRVPARSLDGAGIAALEPDLAGRFARGLHVEGEAHLAPRDALAALRRRLEAAGIHPETGPAPTDGITIDCRGLAARDALPDLRGVRGEMVVLRAPDLNLTRPVRLLHPRYPLYVVPRGGGVHMLGATQIESGGRGPATVRAALELLSAAYALHPAFAEAEILELGADARPAFPDNLPRIRRRGSTIHVNGLFRHGFLLAPAMARMVADWLCCGITPEVCDEDNR